MTKQSGSRCIGLLLRDASIFVLVALTACAPAAPSGRPQGEVQPSPNQTRTLVLAGLGEPPTFGTKFVSTSGEAGGAGTGFFQEELTGRDNRGIVIPRLAVETPRLNTDTWRVFPDGRMETVYRLRPGVTWHDGTPLSARDFVFTWGVAAVPETGAGRTPQNLMEDVAGLDDQTILFKWKQPTILAGELHGGHSGFPALPRHILEEAWGRGDPVAFMAHPYFKTEYVGLGPYRLERWEPGAFMEGKAFVGYTFGKPKIERVRVLFINNQDTMLANFLAGEAHYGGSGLGFTQGQILKREWSRTGVGKVEIYPTDVRYVQIQFKPEDQNPRILSDVRVRRGLAHAIDKQTLAEALFQEEGQAADLYMSPGHRYYAEAERAATKYPYDLRRTDQLFAEAGLVKGPDGQYRLPTGEPFNFQVLSENEKELLVFTDGLRKAGISSDIVVLTAALNRDRALQTHYPALSIRGNHYQGLLFYSNFATERCASAATQYIGANRGCYSTPAFDRLFAQQLAALDEGEIARIDLQLATIISEDIAGIPIYQLISVDGVYPTALLGPDQPIGLDGSRTWNLHEWEWWS